MQLRFPPPLIWLLCAAFILYSAENLTDFSLSYYKLFALFVLLLATSIAILSILAFRQANTTVDPRYPQQTSYLIQQGIFRFSRNPMYLSLALSLLALSCWLLSAVGFLMVFIFIGYITYFQIIPEEQALQQKFGHQYSLYCRRVRRWI